MRATSNAPYDAALPVSARNYQQVEPVECIFIYILCVLGQRAQYCTSGILFSTSSLIAPSSHVYSKQRVLVRFGRDTERPTTISSGCAGYARMMRISRSEGASTYTRAVGNQSLMNTTAICLPFMFGSVCFEQLRKRMAVVLAKEISRQL